MTVLTLLFHRAAIFISPGHLDRTSGPRITGEHGVYLYLYLSMSLSLSMSMSMLSFRLGIRHLLVVTSQTDRDLRQRPLIFLQFRQRYFAPYPEHGIHKWPGGRWVVDDA